MLNKINKNMVKRRRKKLVNMTDWKNFDFNSMKSHKI